MRFKLCVINFNIYRYIVSVCTFPAKRSTLLYSGELRCGSVLVDGLHPSLTHGSMKSQWTLRQPHPGQMVSTCGLNCVWVVGRVSPPNQWKGTPPSNPAVPSGHHPVTSLGTGAAPQWLTSLSVGGGNSKRRDRVIATTSMQKNLQAIAIFCVECHHEPQL